MKHTPGLGRIILALLLVVMWASMGPRMPVWASHLLPRARMRQRRNPRRNRERWERRRARWRRQQPQAQRTRRRKRSKPRPAVREPIPPLPERRKALRRGRPSSSPPDRAVGRPQDPLARWRQQRGLVDMVEARRLWEILRDIRWPEGPRCPHCGESDPNYLRMLDPDYRNGLGRWQCRVCAEAGDEGEGGTFTPLTGTPLEGMRIGVRELWLLAEQFVMGRAGVEAAKEAEVHRHTAGRLYRLFRAAIYWQRGNRPLTRDVEEVTELDEVYITAGLKGRAGGLSLERPPRVRGLKRRGRGTWESDRIPVFGLVRRGGEVQLFVLRNVQTQTIRTIVKRLVPRGGRIHTDSYCIYNFLVREGYRHQVVNHSAGAYALDLDGDGNCEVHCNTVESVWSWLRQMLRTYRGVSKVYLPLYVAQFEFLYNRRHENRWNRTLDLLQALLEMDSDKAAALLSRVTSARFAEVCPVAG